MKQGGWFSGLLDFAKILEELDKKAGKEEIHRGKFGSKGRYEYRLKVGRLKQDKGLSIRPAAVKQTQSIHPRKKRGTEVKELNPEETEKQSLVDIFDEDDHVLVVVELPNVEEKDIDFKIIGNSLKIKINKPEKIEKDISLPKDQFDKIEKVSFKNNILEIKLHKKKKGGKKK